MVPAPWEVLQGFSEMQQCWYNVSPDGNDGGDDFVERDDDDDEDGGGDDDGEFSEKDDLDKVMVLMVVEKGRMTRIGCCKSGPVKKDSKTGSLVMQGYEAEGCFSVDPVPTPPAVNPLASSQPRRRQRSLFFPA